MKLIAGLGNPGKEYEGTRHNIGFMVVSKLAEKHNIPGKMMPQFKAIVGKGVIKGVDTIIVEPLTFMNLSGFSVLKILNWYKIELADLIVVYDDIDFNLGKMRFRPDGSAGGHKGIQSIIDQSGGNQGFSRLRVGIGPGPSGPERKNFVLKPFLPDQQKLVSDTINLAVEGLECFLKEGIQSAMNRYNGIDLTRPKKVKARGKIFIDSSRGKFDQVIYFSNTIGYDTCTINEMFPVDLMTI
jgi:PTH1 family peptidyl-tRNA hydrolase